MSHPQSSPVPQSSPQIRFNDGWFQSTVRVFPHHTDYAGIVWHGTYLTWMEEMRVECLRLAGVNFSDLVTSGCDLPVVNIAIRYHQSIKMGMTVVVKTRIIDSKGVRLPWEYQIESEDSQTQYVSATVTLVPVDRETGKIIRRLPAILQNALKRLLLPLGES